MSETQNTPFLTRCSILADLWLNYRDDDEFVDFIEYADLGLPLAYAISNAIVEETPIAQKFINETFDLLITAMNIQDTGFETLDDIFSMSDGDEPYKES